MNTLAYWHFYFEIWESINNLYSGLNNIAFCQAEIEGRILYFKLKMVFYI